MTISIFSVKAAITRVIRLNLNFKIKNGNFQAKSYEFGSKEGGGGNWDIHGISGIRL